MNDRLLDPFLEGQTLPWSSEADSLGEAFVKAYNPTALQTLKIVRMDIPMEKIQASVRGQATSSRHSAIYGGDAMTERMVLYDMGGRLLVGGFILIRYGENWKIFRLGSTYARTSPHGAADTTTAEEYQSLLGE